jgi:hypothetical protein
MGQKVETSLLKRCQRLNIAQLSKNLSSAGSAMVWDQTSKFDHPSQCATLYGYYLWGYVAKRGIKTCQDCHMRESGLGHNIQAYRDKKMQEMAVDFRVNAKPIYWKDGRVIKPLIYAIVEIQNKRRHAIPDG